ncbi:MAG: hypothetical protein KKE62_01000 [Proteobacteria bacterium]|nr:hypothetical protein [Pseudomonadota bacterium]MBU1388572.1 hypothetical protein [Pseudomonadota bacterium]MBU1541396.1 hypothetical protein [Pseudomonadota bacterium]MBU2480921.1 hypothetical protein [Pseudomonadota bacterium]
MNYPLSKWNYFRLCLVFISGLYGFFNIDSYQTNNFPIGPIQLFVIFLFIPFGLIFIIALQYINKRTGKVWHPPSWKLNPLNFKQPLQFFHFAAFIFIANGLTSSVSLIWKGYNYTCQTVLPLIIGIALLIGIHFCLILFKNRIENMDNSL